MGCFGNGYDVVFGGGPLEDILLKIIDVKVFVASGDVAYRV